MNTIGKTAILLAGGLMGSALALTAQVTYNNDFTSENFSETTGPWTLDTGSGTLNYAETSAAGIFSGTAVEQLSGWGTTDFVVSTRFTVNNNAGTGNPITSGFGVLSESSSLSSSQGDYYLVDWQLGGGGSSNLRIIAFQDGTTVLGETSVGKAVIGETYELRLTGEYDGAGGLDLTWALLDDLGAEIGSLTENHATPIFGDWFGLRNRTHASTDHELDLDYDTFSVVPEPSTYALLAGLAALGGVVLLRRRKTGA